MAEGAPSNEALAEKVVAKAKGRILPGFEPEANSKWTAPFYFVQAADTQLGLISNYGDGSLPDRVRKGLFIWTLRPILIFAPRGKLLPPGVNFVP
jgi:hypothetical protein